jgi:hypothetical protein
MITDMAGLDAALSCSLVVFIRALNVEQNRSKTVLARVAETFNNVKFPGKRRVDYGLRLKGAADMPYLNVTTNRTGNARKISWRILVSLKLALPGNARDDSKTGTNASVNERVALGRFQRGTPMVDRLESINEGR